MKKYKVIEIQTGNIIFSDSSYDDCIIWIENFGNILDYTILEM